ncbi:MAG: hypothetical protein WEG36_07400 [Gemmatimonadota bacterium]
MIGKIATALAYAKAPKTTFMVKHPVKGTKAFVFAKGLQAIFTKRTVLALGTVAMVPVAAVAYKLRRGRKGAASPVK